MSESIPPYEQPERPERTEQPENAPESGARRTRVDLGRLVPRRKGARWAALGAAVVIAGGAAVAVAVAVDGRHDARVVGGPRLAWHEGRAEGPRGPKGAPMDPKELKALREEMREEMAESGPMPHDGARRGHGGFGGPAGPGGAAKAAPAPLPSLPVGQAADKAAGAVEGGKVESIRVVAQEGGGSAWLAVVLGPDGVRHAVTVSGTDGTITGNTTVNGGRQHDK